MSQIEVIHFGNFAYREYISEPVGNKETLVLPAQHDAVHLQTLDNPLVSSLYSMSSMGYGVSSCHLCASRVFTCN